MTEQLSLSQARMLALAGQGLTKATKPNTVLETIDTMGVLQIDSVNVFERAHYMPLYSRLGAYDKTELDDLHGGKHPTLLEYWAHEASFIRTEDYPLFDFRMEYNQRGSRSRWEIWAKDNREFLEWIKNEIRIRGPLSTSDFEHERAERKGSWWGWSDVKHALEYMFMYGELVSGGREGFSRLYALPEQVLPKKLINKTVEHEIARKQLLLRAAKSHGVATAKDLADYYRQILPKAKPQIEELVQEKKLIETRVEGWKETAYILPNMAIPKEKPSKTTLLS
ncbi:MAG: winged helix-turn-helix domain-containing protein, partial [Micrococcales bacterium]